MVSGGTFSPSLLGNGLFHGTLSQRAGRFGFVCNTRCDVPHSSLEGEIRGTTAAASLRAHRVKNLRNLRHEDVPSKIGTKAGMSGPIPDCLHLPLIKALPLTLLFGFLVSLWDHRTHCSPKMESKLTFARWTLSSLCRLCSQNRLASFKFSYSRAPKQSVFCP